MPSIEEILNQDLDTEKTASENEQEEEVTQDIEKIASEYGLFEDLFPEDREVFGEKTAQEEKVAYADQLGQRAYSYCSGRFDRRIEKIAAEISEMAEREMAEGIMAPDNLPPQSIPNDANAPMDDAPRNPSKETPYALVSGAEAGAEGQVGHQEQQSVAADAAQDVKMAAAVQKHLLRMRLGK